MTPSHYTNKWWRRLTWLTNFCRHCSQLINTAAVPLNNSFSSYSLSVSCVPNCTRDLFFSATAFQDCLSPHPAYVVVLSIDRPHPAVLPKALSDYEYSIRQAWSLTNGSQHGKRQDTSSNKRNRTKQGARSSSRAELVGVSDLLSPPGLLCE